MGFLYVLEKLRVPGLNEFMLLVTKLGEETVFLALALIVFWCVDKRKGYLLISVCFIGNLINGALKLLFRVPRPWVLDPEFTILEQARKAATGYSFPSGHSQSAVGLFGSIAATTRKKWIFWLCVACGILVPVSRMYVGVHTPADVLVGSGCALALVFLLKPISGENGDKYMKPLIAFMLTMGICYLCFVHLFPFPEDVDPENLTSGMKNGYTMVGSIIGFAIAYLGERKYVNFSTDGKWWVQVLKAILGFALVLAIKEGLRVPLNCCFGELVGRGVRYALIVIFAGFAWPMSFSWLQKLGEKG